MADFLEEKKEEIRSRIAELQEQIAQVEPLREEVGRLEAALAALEGRAPVKPPTRSERRERSGSTDGGGAAGRRGRPKGSGTRGKQALELVTANPGITIPELAEKMEIQQNYLYRVMPDLQKEGLVRKEGRGWHAMDAA